VEDAERQHVHGHLKSQTTTQFQNFHVHCSGNGGVI
jgi:hypothetical protein